VVAVSFLFVTKSLAAPDAIIQVAQRCAAQVRLHHLAAREVANNVFKLLTVHAKHLSDFTAVSAGSARTGCSLFSKSARARCKRERTVPIAHPNTSAASA